MEVIHKWKRVAPIYILGVRKQKFDQKVCSKSLLKKFAHLHILEIQVLTASVGYCIVDHYSLIGASGGIYCLIAACVPDIIVNWKESRAVFIQVCKDDFSKSLDLIFMLAEVQTRTCGARV